MGACTSKSSTANYPYAPTIQPTLEYQETPPAPSLPPVPENNFGKKTPFFSFYTPSPARYFFSKKNSPVPENDSGAGKKTPFFSFHTPSQARGKNSMPATPGRFFRRQASPAKHIRAALVRWKGNVEVIDGGKGSLGILDKTFGYSQELKTWYEIGEEVGRGHFGYTCCAKALKGEVKGQNVAVKIIPKSKMTTAIAIEDVRREVKLLKALKGHNNLTQFYDAFEDTDNVYIVMELCEGGELLDRILARGGKYAEDDAKAVMIQILNVVAFCHLQGVVHRDLKPENFLFATKEENSLLKAIDFGLADYVRPDEKLNDIVGSSYYVAPEVLHRSYSTESDVWSIGVIVYILLCGCRPFWARTESGIFRAVVKAEPSFEEEPWPLLSFQAKDFVKRLLNKDLRKRMTAAQALSHPWIRGCSDIKVPLDILIFRLLKSYMRTTPLRKAALRALSKTLNTDDVFYLKEQFALLEPNKSNCITLESITSALMKHATDAMKESRTPEYLASLNALQYRRMDFEEFCAAALSVHQMEARDHWEQHTCCAYELFEKDGNRLIVIEELASELGVGSSVSVHAVIRDWIRPSDGKLSFLGYVKLLRGKSIRTTGKGKYGVEACSMSCTNGKTYPHAKVHVTC